MSIHAIVRRLLGTKSDGPRFECQHCGTSFDKQIESCPQCGSESIAEYRVRSREDEY